MVTSLHQQFVFLDEMQTFTRHGHLIRSMVANNRSVVKRAPNCYVEKKEICLIKI